MLRARRTAELAGFEHAAITPLLREVGYGAYEGKTLAEIHAVDPGWEVFLEAPPDGESPQEIYARAEQFVSLVMARNEGRVIAFSHGHFSRAVGVAWINANIEVAAGLELDVSTVSILRAADRGRVIALWNSP